MLGIDITGFKFQAHILAGVKKLSCFKHCMHNQRVDTTTTNTATLGNAVIQSGGTAIAAGVYAAEGTVVYAGPVTINNPPSTPASSSNGSSEGSPPRTDSSGSSTASKTSDVSEQRFTYRIPKPKERRLSDADEEFLTEMCEFADAMMKNPEDDLKHWDLDFEPPKLDLDYTNELSDKVPETYVPELEEHALFVKFMKNFNSECLNMSHAEWGRYLDAHRAKRNEILEDRLFIRMMGWACEILDEKRCSRQCCLFPFKR